MSYDIFISYRRVDSSGKVSGRDIARTLQKELQIRGYKVFFDYSEILDNEFEKTILPAIQSSRVFILLLTCNALDRCINSEDWVRREILMAKQANCKIIPVNPDNSFCGWPTSLPTDISFIKKIQISEIATNSLFESSIDKLERDRIKTIIQNKGSKEKCKTATSSTKTLSQLHIIERQEKFGFVNALGEIVIPCIWNKADLDIHNGLIRVQDDNGRWGFIDKEGNTVIACQWNDSEKKFSDDLVCVKNEKNKWGYINKTGEAVLPFIWDEAKSFYNGLANVKGRKNGWSLFSGDSKWGTIDKSGKFVLPNKWTECGSAFHEGLLNVKDEYNKWGYIDITGRMVIPSQWDDAGIFSEGMARVGKYYHKMLSVCKWGYVNKYGENIISTDFYFTYDFEEGMANVSKTVGKWNLINKEGNEIFHIDAFFPLTYREGLACVHYHDSTGAYYWRKCGFVDFAGNEIIPPVWSLAGNFSSGLAPVSDKNKKWGYIDKNGKIVIPCQWEKAEDFNGDYAWVKDNKTWRLITKDGGIITL